MLPVKEGLANFSWYCVRYLPKASMCLNSQARPRSENASCYRAIRLAVIAMFVSCSVTSSSGRQEVSELSVPKVSPGILKPPTAILVVSIRRDDETRRFGNKRPGKIQYANLASSIFPISVIPWFWTAWVDPEIHCAEPRSC